MTNNTIAQLEAEMNEIKAKIEKEKGKEDARDEVIQLLQTLGYELGELFEPPTKAATDKKPKRTRVKAKYRNPENKMQNWAAANPDDKPQWVVEYIKNGGELEDLRIAGT
jgi:hypothetical protein